MFQLGKHKAKEIVGNSLILAKSHNSVTSLADPALFSRSELQYARSSSM